MKKIIVTGSLGYLGSVLTHYLEEQGYDVLGYDTGFFADSILYAPPTVKTVFKDARDITETDLKGADAVIHLAGISNDPVGNLDPATVYDPTRVYALEIAKLCKKLGIKFIFASSCSIYGKGGSELVDENSPVFPQTGYSLNKMQIEQDLISISDKDFSPIAFRFATVFGLSPRLRFDVVVNMFAGMAAATKKIILNSDGSPWRPNIHILDVCQAFHGAIELDHHAGELLILNAGDEKNNLQVLQMAKLAQQAVPGCELKFLTENPELDKEGLIGDRKVKGGVDTRTYSVSFAKIRKTLPGFECKWSVEKGIKDMVEKFQEISMDEAMFKRKGFYRLQQLEYLHNEKYLSNDLRWLKERPSYSA